jgi:lysozyme
MNPLINQLKRHEGLRLKPYRCTSGKLSIGIGRNLDDIGISEAEAEALLRHDIIEATKQLLNAFPWMSNLNDARIGAMLNFTFNVGIGTVKKFKNTLAFMKCGDYDAAGDEMMDSKWARQVGNRATEITDQIRSGKWVKS